MYVPPTLSTERVATNAASRNIFLQLCTGGDLFTYITEHSARGRLICEAETKYIMYQIFQAVKYLHDSFISHRDLKVWIRSTAQALLTLTDCPLAGEYLLAYSRRLSSDHDWRLRFGASER